MRPRSQRFVRWRASELVLVAISFSLAALDALGCGPDSSNGAAPGADSGAPDSSTQPPADASRGDAGSGESSDPDSAPPPSSGVCGFATDAGAAFECDDSAMCSGTTPVCCLEGTFKIDPTCGALVGSRIVGTACRASCGPRELMLCAKDAECASATCTPLGSKGHVFGVCASPTSGGIGLGIDAGCGKGLTLDPTDGGAGPFCPFSDAGRCARGATCCHPSNVDPEYCR